MTLYCGKKQTHDLSGSTHKNFICHQFIYTGRGAWLMESITDSGPWGFPSPHTLPWPRSPEECCGKMGTAPKTSTWNWYRSLPLYSTGRANTWSTLTLGGFCSPGELVKNSQQILNPKGNSYFFKYISEFFKFSKVSRTFFKVSEKPHNKHYP